MLVEILRWYHRRYSGYVEREQLLRLMVAMETCGVATRFTHPTHLYKVTARTGKGRVESAW